MFIICWNTQGNSNLRTMGSLASILAPDLLILLEPSKEVKEAKYLPQGRVDGNSASDRGERSDYEGHAHPDPHLPQGDVVFFAPSGVTILSEEPIETAATKDLSGRAIQERQLLIIRAKKGRETVTIATCHAPYGGGSGGEASTYCKKVRDALDDMVETSSDIPPDIWLGDLNTYGESTKVPTKAETKTPNKRIDASSYQRISGLGPTSNARKGSGGSKLDQIYVRTGFEYGDCGRILPADKKCASDGNVEDLTMPEWRSAAVMNSDHFPIYIKTAAAPAHSMTTRAKAKKDATDNKMEEDE